MKLGVDLNAVTILGAMVLLGLGGTGCATSGHQVSRENNLPTPLSWSAGGGSAVSPLGDAPGERDLALISGWYLAPASSYAPGVNTTASR